MSSRPRGLSSCYFWAPAHQVDSCGPWASLLRGMRVAPGPGIEPLSPHVGVPAALWAGSGVDLSFTVEATGPWCIDGFPSKCVLSTWV